MKIRTRKQLGEAIRRFRRKKGFTQANIAKQTGLRQPTISDIENGNVATTETLFKVIAALDIEIQFSPIDRKAALFDFK